MPAPRSDGATATTAIAEDGASSATATVDERSGSSRRRFRFDGEGGALFGLYVKNIALTVSTLGVYRFWAAVAMRKFRYQHTEFHGGRFDYHASGLEKLVGFLKGLLFLIPVGLLLFVLYQALRPELGDEQAGTACFWSFMLLMWLLRPVIVVGSNAFNLSRTSWSQMRLRFTGSVGELYRIHLRDTLFLVLSLGFYYPWYECNQRRFRMGHSRLGDEGLEYRGQGGDLFGTWYGGLFLTYLTLGLYAPWLHASVHRFHMNHTSFQGRRFHSELTGGQLFGLYVGGALVVIATLGLALPWVTTRYLQLMAETTSYRGTLNVAALRSKYDARADAAAEGFGEAGEALADLAQVFGG